MEFVKALMRGVPLGCLVVGLGLSVLAGGIWWTVLGALAAVLIVAPNQLSSRARRLKDAAAGDEARLSDLRGLAQRLAQVTGVPGAEQQGLQLREQFDGACSKYANFRKLLATKFSPGELTYGRYLKSADQVFLSMLDSMQNAATVLDGLRAIDSDTLRARVRMLERKAERSGAEEEELSTLRERTALRESELEALRGLLATNEQSLTMLTQAGAALSGLDTGGARAALDADSAMRELELLVERAENYAINPPVSPEPILVPRADRD